MNEKYGSMSQIDENKKALAHTVSATKQVKIDPAIKSNTLLSNLSKHRESSSRYERYEETKELTV